MNKNYDFGLKFLIYGLDIFNNSPYLIGILANIFFQIGNYSSCKTACESCLKEIEKGHFIFLEKPSIKAIKQNIHVELLEKISG